LKPQERGQHWIKYADDADSVDENLTPNLSGNLDQTHVHNLATLSALLAQLSNLTRLATPTLGFVSTT
jgi:hypothetical protein